MVNRATRFAVSYALAVCIEFALIVWAYMVAYPWATLDAAILHAAYMVVMIFVTATAVTAFALVVLRRL